MILKKLVLNNYKTYYGHQELILDIPKKVREEKQRNIILVGGLNGAGKTTILKAIRYALFGQRGMDAQEYKRVFSNVINNNFFDEGGRECFIVLTVENDNIEEWELKVKWIFDGNKKIVHESRDITIRKPGASTGRTSAINSIDTYNRFIDRKIPYHVAPFFIFDGEEIKDTILRQNSNEMKSAIQKLSGLEVYKLLFDDLHEARNYLEKKLSSALNTPKTANYSNELNRVIADLEEISKKMKSVLQRKEELEKQIETVKKVRAEKSKQNSRSRENIVKKLTTLENNLSNAQEEFDRKFKESAYLYILSSPIQQLKKAIQAEDQEREKERLSLISYTPYKQFLDKLLCNNITPPLLQDQIDQLHDFGQQIWSLEHNKSNSSKAVYLHDLNKQQYNYLINLPVKSSSDLVEIYNRISKIQTELNQAEEEIRNAPEYVEIEEENVQIDNLSKMLGEVELRLRSFRSKSNSLREEKIKYENLLTRSTNTDTNIDSIKRQLDHVNALIDFLQQYITEVTQIKANFIHSEFKRMLGELIRKQDEFGQIEFDLNTYTIRLYNDRNQEISIQDRSAGEMQIISSALIWALTKSSKFTLPMIIDTPLGRLDSYHRDHLINKYYKELSEQVIILSTDTEITQEYINTITENSYKQFSLDYNDKLKYTIIREGYFDKKR